MNKLGIDGFDTIHPYHPFKNETEDEIKQVCLNYKNSKTIGLNGPGSIGKMFSDSISIQSKLPFTKEEYSLYKTAKEGLVKKKIKEIVETLEKLKIKNKIIISNF